MKKTLLLLFAIIQITAFAQAPKAFKYQAIARDITGSELLNQAVSFQISIIEGSVNGASVYTETHTATTNQFGLVNLSIGGGTVVNGIFDSIHWGANSFFIKIELDASGGTNYQLMGTSQLMSVPYALFAERSNTPGPKGDKGDQGIPGNDGVDGAPGVTGPAGSFPAGNNPGDMEYWNGTQWVVVPGGSEGQNLTFCNGRPIWGPCPPLSLPTLVTDSVYNITSKTANSKSSITFDGNALITARGICYSTHSSPTLGDSVATSGAGLGGFVSNMVELAVNTTYYVRAYATNSVGTGYGNELSFTTALTSNYSIGQIYGGGIIFYIDPTTQHGLIADTVDSGPNFFGCYGTSIVGADAITIGSGPQNTLDILASCSATNNAASICANLVKNGYSDWFLPAKDELNLIFVNLYDQGYMVSSFVHDYYESSSEYSANEAWALRMDSGVWDEQHAKNHPHKIRAVRAF